MSLPIITVRVAFASNPMVASPTWTDISHDVMSFYISRGRQHELDRMEAGTATIVLKNTSGNYWPSGIYSPNLLPGKAVNIRATYGGTTYDRYYGFAEAWQPDWQSRAGGLAPIVTLRCADLVKNLSRLKLNNAGYSAELSGTRVTNVLTSLGWLGTTDIEAGISTMQATGALVNAGAMEHLFLVQQSELGIFFIAGDGHPQFQDRHTRLKSPYTSSQATFGDDAGEQHYHDLEPSYDDTFIYNDVTLTRNGGSQQQATDATSITTYGQRTLSRTALLMTQDTEALSQAQFLLSHFKDATLRSRTLTINAERDPGNLWPKVLGYDISTRITLRLNQAGINTEYHIEGTQDIYDAARGTYIVKWQLSDADNQQYWVIGVAGFSEIGETTRVCY